MNPEDLKRRTKKQFALGSLNWLPLAQYRSGRTIGAQLVRLKWYSTTGNVRSRPRQSLVARIGVVEEEAMKALFGWS